MQRVWAIVLTTLALVVLAVSCVGAEQGPPGYTYCAGEDYTCSFTGTKVVAYGAGTTFVYKTLSNGTECRNSVFGDPAPGIRKFCYTQDVVTGSTQGTTNQACRVTQRLDQPEKRDASGRILVEAAMIQVVDCGGNQFYIYQYVNRPGFRAIRPPDWGHAIGGRDFSSFEEALAAARASGGAGGNAGGSGGDVFGPMQNGYALNGTRLTYFSRPTAGECMRDCAGNGSCQGFTWIQAGTYNRGDAAMCYLLSAVSGRVAAAGSISSVKGAH